MKGIFNIKRYNAILVDGKWEPGELIEEREEDNFISISQRHQINGGKKIVVPYNSSPVKYGRWDNQQYLAIAQSRILSKSLTLDNIEIDSASTTTSDWIQGYHTPGKEYSELTLGSPNSITVESRFNPPASIRNVYSIANKRGAVTTEGIAISVLSLETPVIQQTNDLLIITHQYSWYDEDFDTYLTTLVNEEQKERIGPLLAAGEYTENPFLNRFFYRFQSPPPVDDLSTLVEQSYSATGQWKTSDLVNRNYQDGYHTRGVSVGVALHSGSLFGKIQFRGEEEVDNLVNSVAFTDKYTGVNITDEVPLRRPTDTVIQSTFHKKPESLGTIAAKQPFQDTDTIGTGLGSSIIEDDVSSGDTSYVGDTGLANLYRVNITTGGALGTAQYQISKRKFSGVYDLNGWRPKQTSYINIQTENAITTIDNTEKIHWKDGILRDYGTQCYQYPYPTEYFITPYTFPEFISVDPKHTARNAVHINSIETALPITFDANSTPALPVTDIRQIIGFDDGEIIVACATTGLWKITRAVNTPVSSATITRIIPSGLPVGDDLKCYAFVTNDRVNSGKKGDKWWALFNGNLCHSAAGGASWTVLNAGTTPEFDLTTATAGNTNALTDYSYIYSMHLDLNHPDERFFFVSNNAPMRNGMGEGNETTAIKGYWWSVGGSSGNTGTDTDAVSYNGLTTNQGFHPLIINQNIIHCPYTDYWAFRYVSATSYRVTWASKSSQTSRLSNTSVYANNVAIPYQDTSRVGQEDQYMITHNIGKQVSFADHNAAFVDNVLTKVFYLLDSPETLGFPMIYPFYNASVFLLLAKAGKTDIDVSYSQFYNVASGPRLMSLLTLGDIDNNDDDYWYNDPFNIWERYGWTGSAWLLGDAGSKFTHAGLEPLLDGLSNKFEEDAGFPGDADNFVVDDFYDTYAFDGILKDDTTSFSTNALLFYGPSITGTDLADATVPASSTGLNTIPYATDGLSFKYNHLTTPSFVFESDYIGAASQVSGSGQNDSCFIGPNLLGDFTISFRMSSAYYLYSQPLPPSNTYYSLFGLSNVADINTAYFPPQYTVHIVQFDDVNGARVYINDLGTGTKIALADITDFNPIIDVWKFVRSGDTLTLLRNDTLMYTYGGGSGGSVIPAGITLKGGHYTPNDRFSLSILDADVTFTDTFHTVEFGNGTTTATNSPDYGYMSIEEYRLGHTNIFIDGVAATVVNLDDNWPAPLAVPTAAGQVAIHRGSGRISFHPSDAGKTITTDKWRMIPRVNKV